ncbi:MAG: response regulator [Candidatus Aminicenantes bacterium]|nr:response regulator [Candidatus Aminicenantes bacterium]
MDRQTILVVDDEMVFVRSISSHLVETGSGEYSVKEAYNGREALEIIEKERVDLVILDINMPVLDGIETLIELHNRCIWLPIIILTGLMVVTQGEGNIFEDFGIVEYMEKPVHFERLDKRAAEVLNRFAEIEKPASGIGLPLILRVIENERKTGVLTVTYGKRTWRIFFKDGDVVDVESMGLSAEEAFNECLRAVGKKEKKISIEYLHHEREKRIEKSLSRMLLDMAEKKE